MLAVLIIGVILLACAGLLVGVVFGTDLDLSDDR